MSIRKLLYWPHLTCGVLAAVIILIMSVTGVLLTYERQIIAWAETDYETITPASIPPLPIDEILSKNNNTFGDHLLKSVKIYNNPDAPVVVRGEDYYYVNRSTGEILGNGPKGVKAFFSEMRSGADTLSSSL